MWKIRDEVAIKFPTSYLDNFMKAWYHLIGAKWMLITHYSDVIRERVALLFAIQSGKTIDIGDVIQ